MEKVSLDSASCVLTPTGVLPFPPLGARLLLVLLVAFVPFQSYLEVSNLFEVRGGAVFAILFAHVCVGDVRLSDRNYSTCDTFAVQYLLSRLADRLSGFSCDSSDRVDCPRIIVETIK